MDLRAAWERLDASIRNKIRREIPFDEGCWLWTGALHYRGRAGEGYGRKSWKGRNWLAHRLVYTLLVGEIGEGLVLDHVKTRCRNRHCVRPDHLEPVTPEENTRRGDAYHYFGFDPPEPEMEDVPF